MEVDQVYDVLVIGAGVSGSFLARSLAKRGKSVLLIEAGRSFDASTYPLREADASAQLYWSGGIELTHDARIGLLRPKAVGGGSVVNQALLDRFDDEALNSWKKRSGVDFFASDTLSRWYEKAEASVSLQEIPAKYWNRNAEIFAQGFEKNGFMCASLRRAQSDCRYEEGNDCIECLAGCRINSKQSMPITVLKEALDTGNVTLLSELEAERISEDGDQVKVTARSKAGMKRVLRGRHLALASGSLGNTKLLLRSGYADRYEALGKGFFTHPQYMSLALYSDPVRAHKGPFQALKSADPGFRKNGFKLENVFAPPAALAMLISGFGESHMKTMEMLPYMACIEVAIRDTERGVISLKKDGTLLIRKNLNAEDRRRRDAGVSAVDRIFNSTGAQRIIRGDIAVGLHLMGGCAIGVDRSQAMVDPEFKLMGSKRITIADSSIFPDAPGINPSLTIMALSMMAAETIP